jgi:hypothetical protein
VRDASRAGAIMTSIFISYRRDDTEGESTHIADRLQERFGEDNVFFDRTTRGGDRWRERIDGALAKCDVVLAVIGRNWATLETAPGKRRLDDPDDVVAYEIAKALERKVRLIPVLVQRAALPRSAELPERLRGLPDFQAREIRSDAFDRDFQVLLRDIAGRWLLPSRPVLTSAAIAAVVVAGALAWSLWPRPEPPARAAPAARALGDLQLRVRLNPNLDPEVRAADRIWMYLIEPERLPKAQLEAPTLAIPDIPEFKFTYLMPGEGERFEADLVREVQTSALGTPVRTTVCFTRAPNVNAPRLAAKLECEEGARCKVAKDDPGQVRACGERPTSRSWPFDLSPVAHAHAQEATPQQGWIVPSLETLRRRHAGPDAPAYTEITLASGPLPALAQAKHVSVGIEVNGRTAWVDGLPVDANAVPFDAAKGVDVQLGLENLEFSGAQRGFERVELTLRFLDGRNVIREAKLPLRYVALRDKPDPAPVGEPDLGVRWSAKYIPGPTADRYQIFLLSSPSAEEIERVKQRFDAAGFTVATAKGTLPLVAVIRPPLKENGNYGLALGMRQPTGQIRFSFDEAASVVLCGRLHRIAQEHAFVRKNSFRRNIDDVRDSKQCAAFSPQ